MSHYTVLVIGEDHEKALRPFHEFECTGIADEHVQSIDELPDARAGYESGTSTRIKAPDGTYHPSYDDRFYRELTDEEKASIGDNDSVKNGLGLNLCIKDWGDEKGRRQKAYFIPEGWEKVEVPDKELFTFREYCDYHHGRPVVLEGQDPDLQDEHKFGYMRINDAGEVIELVDRTNPNAKWDWYQVGGRWSGLLKLKPGARGESGSPGLFGSHAAKGSDRCDQAKKGDVDWDGMRDEQGAKAAAEWDKAAAAKTAAGFASETLWDSWEAVRARHPNAIDDARTEYHEQPVLKALKAAFTSPFYEFDPLLASRDAFIQRARDSACTTFAVLKDGQWYERGSMGWWGMVADEKAPDEWNRQFAELVDSLADDTILTVVDCHI